MRTEITNFWRERSRRERALLVCGAALLTFGLLYAYVWLPIERDRTRLTAELPAMRAQARQMRADALELERLRATTKAAPQDLRMFLVDSTAGPRFGRAVPQVTGEGDGRVRVAFSAVQAADWLGWINALAVEQGIRVVAVRMDLLDQPGAVKVSVTFAGAER